MKCSTIIIICLFCYGLGFGQSVKEALLWQDSAQVYLEKRKFERAFLCIEKGFVAHKEQDSIYADFLTLLGDLAYETGDKTQAEIYRDQELTLRSTIQPESHPKYSMSLSNLAGLYGEMNRFADAESLFKQSLVIQKKYFGEFYENYLLDLNNLAELYVRMDKLPESEQLYTQAVTIAKKIYGTKHPDYALLLHNMGILYQKLGNLPKSIACLEEAVQIRLEALGEQNPETAASVNSLAVAYHGSLRYKEALDMYYYVLGIREGLNGKKHPEYANIINNLAILQQDLKHYPLAESLYKVALSIRKQYLPGGEKHPIYANSLRSLGSLYEEQQAYLAADSLYFQALNIRAAALGEKHIEYATSLRDMANIRFLLEDYETAEDYYEEAIAQILERIETLFPSLSEKEKSRLYENNLKPTLERFVSFALVRGGYQGKTIGKPNPAISGILYDNQLATKSLLLQATNKIRQQILASKDSTLIKTYEHWRYEKEQLAKLYNMSINQRKKANINLDSVLQLTNDLEKQLSKQSQLFATTTTQKRTWKEITNLLKKGEVAIEIIQYHIHQGKTALKDSVGYLALVLTPQTKTCPMVVLLPNGNLLEHQIYTYYKRSIRNKLSDEESYAYFWKPIANALPKGTKKVYFSGDGVYHQINLNTLLNPETQKYVLDEVDIELVSSTKSLLERSQKTTTFITPKATLVGYPDYNFLDGRKSSASHQEVAALPGTQKEILSLLPLLINKGWMVDTFTQCFAVEKTLKKIQSPNVLHIATHGNFDPKQTEVLQKPQLLLAGACYGMTSENQPTQSGENGVLTAFEAMNLNLDKTELVVLSACETGKGEITSGEGVYGLQRSFQVAGAKAIVMSLWKVNDEVTQKLMVAFYTRYLIHHNKRLALREAELMVRKEHPEPYFWGAFVMVGE